MEDLDARIRALSALDRVPMIKALIQIDSEAQSQSRTGRRAKRGSVDRNRAEEAAAESARLGRIIYFLRFRSLATNTSARDEELCAMLAGTLQAKGQWTGEYSI
jgi:hypothetical protein